MKRTPRQEELLIQRALSGLSDAESRELAELGGDGEASFEQTVAALDLATLPEEAMPVDLAARILAAAPVKVGPVTELAARRASVLPWLAAAASLSIAFGAIAWSTTRPPVTVQVTVPVPASVASPPPAPPTPAEQRSTLLASTKDAARLDWKTTKDAAGKGATGDVVWSPSTQKGFMRFVGLEPNDPAKTQYQLWIFDKERDAKYPVDGGVFDVPASGEVVVPITARLHVDQATLFAVTVERPGGVVVSKRERIVLTASPG